MRPHAILAIVLRAAPLAGAVLTLAGVPRDAHAQSVLGKEHARKLFEEGLELEKSADYAGALARYREAGQILVTPGLRFHEGYCLEMTGKLASALEVYEAADKAAREQGKADVEAAVAARREALAARVPKIAIRFQAPPSGAVVELDGTAVAAPLLVGRAFRLDPGEHLVTARAPGYRAFERSVSVPETITTDVEVTLTPASDGPIEADSPEGSPPRSLVLPIAFTAGAAAFVAGGVLALVSAGGVADDARRECTTLLSCDDRSDRVRLLDGLALTSFLVGAGLGVASVVLWSSPPRSAKPVAQTRLVTAPSFVGVTGTFE